MFLSPTGWQRIHCGDTDQSCGQKATRGSYETHQESPSRGLAGLLMKLARKPPTGRLSGSWRGTRGPHSIPRSCSRGPAQLGDQQVSRAPSEQREGEACQKQEEPSPCSFRALHSDVPLLTEMNLGPAGKGETLAGPVPAPQGRMMERGSGADRHTSASLLSVLRLRSQKQESPTLNPRNPEGSRAQLRT